jgi:3-phosphoshikimate 1-carboxyvinyltransferase
MAYAGARASDVSIHVNGLVSRPYIDLTLEIMERFGLVVPTNNNYQSFIFNKSNPVINPSRLTYTIEGDWSGAAFLLVAATLAGEVIIQGIDPNSKQADRQILSFAHQAQLNIEELDQSLSIKRSAVKPFEVDATDCPDLFPPLTALAVFAEGTSRIKGVNRLTHKESNRGLALVQEFSKLGATLEIENDDLVIRGQDQLSGGQVSSHHDHRIAMALAIAGLRAVNPVVIENAEAVGKSYPSFFSHLQSLGASVSLSSH